MSTSTRTVECRYNGCGKLFTSKPRMKEHVLLHLETDPPVPIHQHAIVQYRKDGGWTVLRDLSLQDGDESLGGPSQIGSEIEKFRITDILPTESQAANTTMTTTTSGGTTSQSLPYTFSPVLPDRPSQISLPSQGISPIRPFNSLPNPAQLQSQPNSLSKSLIRRSSREPPPLPPSPFVHSAPSRPNTNSPSPTIARKRLTGNSMSPIKKRTRLSASPFVPDTQARSSTPRSRTAQVIPTQSDSDSSHYPPASGSSGEHPGTSSKDTDIGADTSAGIGTPGKEARRTFGFGEALGLSEKKATPDTRSGVTFGFGTR